MTKHIHGGDVYKYDHCLDFSANCNPLGTPKSVKQAIIDSVEDLSDYPRVGCGPLKEAIADYEHTKKRISDLREWSRRPYFFPQQGIESKEGPSSCSYLCGV